MPQKEFEREIETAIESTKDVPEPFKIEAFKIVLNRLLQSELSRKPKTQPKGKKKTAPEKREEAEIDINQIPTPEGFHDWNWHDRFLFLLDWASESHPDNGFTSGEISKILDERFGFPGLHSRHVASKLKTHLISSRYATRKAIGTKRYRWHINPYGREYVRDLLEQAPSQ